jgi:hypothetical protein
VGHWSNDNQAALLWDAGVRRVFFSGDWDEAAVTNLELQLSLCNLFKTILSGCPGTWLDSGLLDSERDGIIELKFVV